MEFSIKPESNLEIKPKAFFLHESSREAMQINKSENSDKNRFKKYDHYTD